jgi:hypothetical protein
MNFVAASYYVQVPDPYMVANVELLHPEDQIEMANLNVVVNPALPRINDAEADSNAFADVIVEEESVARPL